MKVIIYRDKATKKIVRDVADDYERLKELGKTDEDIAALVKEFNGRENCLQTVEIVELDEVAEYYRTQKLNAYKEQLNDFAFMEDRLDELSRMIENYYEFDELIPSTMADKIDEIVKEVLKISY